jgi:hypothetical protein
MNEQKKLLKLRIKYELAYEIIFISSFIILFGLAYLFASNLLAFNWFTVFFGLLAAVFLYLKYQSYLLIENDVLSIVYFKFITKETIDMKTVSEFVFYEKSRIVEVKSSDKIIANLHLTNKNKQKLMTFLVKQYPNIPTIFNNRIE